MTAPLRPCVVDASAWIEWLTASAPGMKMGLQFPGKLPLDTAIALLAADLHREHTLATANAIVYATAQHQKAELLTRDAHSDRLPGVVFFSKAA
jgi:predicted nucleic acid-binding protein